MNPLRNVLTIDIGLTNCKVTLFTIDGRLVAQASQRYPTHTPQPGWSEQDPRDWMVALRICIKSLRARASRDLDAASMISITGHMHGLIAVDGETQPLTNCWTLFDQRAEQEAREINQTLGTEVAYRLTGARLEGYAPAAKMLWLKKHAPETFARAVLFLAPKDLLRLMLGGEKATDPIDAAGMLIYELEKGDWSAAILESMGLSTEKLPEVRACTADGGHLCRSVANELGLRDGIPILIGAGDDVEALGAGLGANGQVLEHLGTTGTLLACVANATFDPQQRVEVYPHTVPGFYLVGGATNAAGRSLDWARHWLRGDPNDQGTLSLKYPPSNSVPRPPLYLPFINGERGLLWDAHASGVIVGLLEAHTHEDMARAVFEGVAFSLKEILAGVQNLGVETAEIISGTPLLDRGWAQLRADIYGRPLCFPAASDMTALGAALLALVNQQVFPDLPTAIKRCCHVTQRIDPLPTRTRHYDRVFKTYQAAIQVCHPLFGGLLDPRLGEL